MQEVSERKNLRRPMRAFEKIAAARRCSIGSSLAEQRRQPHCHHTVWPVRTGGRKHRRLFIPPLHCAVRRWLDESGSCSNTRRPCDSDGKGFVMKVLGIAVRRWCRGGGVVRCLKAHLLKRSRQCEAFSSGARIRTRESISLSHRVRSLRCSLMAFALLAASTLSAVPQSAWAFQSNGPEPGQPVVVEPLPNSQTVPTIRRQIEVVNVYAVVKDKHGRLIPNLSKDDFTLTEDGVSQKITYFSKTTDTPLTMGMMIDTSPSQGQVLQIEKDEADSFLHEVLRPKDLCFVVHFDVDTEVLQDLTASLPLLTRAIDQTVINGGGVGPTPSTFPISGGATHLYDAVYLATHDILQNEVGRKVLMILSDGVDQGSNYKLSQALDAAQEANVIIYAVDIVDRMFYVHAGGFGENGDAVLHKLAEETGGESVRVSRSKDTAAVFQHIADELRTQYLLGYTPTNKNRDGTFRRIKVRVTDPSFKVQARLGYYAPRN
jgi:VWFA-related protein